MARTKEQIRATELKSRKKIYDMLLLKIRKDLHIFDALTKASEETNITKNQYSIQAIKEKLRRDGFLDNVQEVESDHNAE